MSDYVNESDKKWELSLEELRAMDAVINYGNGFVVKEVYANEVDGTYGDIYKHQYQAEDAHPGCKILRGFVVIDTSTGLVPDNCKDWNWHQEEAAFDYRMNVLPTLDRDIMLTTPAEPIIRANGYVRDEISFSVKSSWLQTFFGVGNHTQMEALLKNSDSWNSAEIFAAAKKNPEFSGLIYEEEKIEEYKSAVTENIPDMQSREVSDSEEKETTSEITVPTPLGDIVVSIKTDSEYPGVYIDLKGDKVNDTFADNTVMLATVEYDPYKKAVQTIVYADCERDEPSHVVEHENVEKSIPLEKPTLDSIISSAAGRTGGICKDLPPRIPNPER